MRINTAGCVYYMMQGAGHKIRQTYDLLTYGLLLLLYSINLLSGIMYYFFRLRRENVRLDDAPHPPLFCGLAISLEPMYVCINLATTIHIHDIQHVCMYDVCML
jgi:hypothetical protein